MKPVQFLGSALKDLRAFPAASRRVAGRQLDKVQRGEPPDDFKPMPTVGRGVYEIRIAKGGQAHRVLYVARFEEAVYVLHAFEKKTPKTSRRDIDTARNRYRALLEAREA